MPWESPYRGEESPLAKLSPRVRELISRGALLLVGLAMAFVGGRALLFMVSDASVAATQPAGAVMRTNVGGYALLSMIALSLLGLLTMLAAVVPVSVMERVFRSVNEPPTTGDRGMDDVSFTRTWLGWWFPRWWR